MTTAAPRDADPLGALVDAARSAERVHQGAEVRHYTAIGAGCDYPTDPGLTVVVHRGRIVGLEIGDDYLNKPVDEINDVLNAVIMNAFANWRVDGAPSAE